MPRKSKRSPSPLVRGVQLGLLVLCWLALAGAATATVRLRFVVWEGDEAMKPIRNAVAAFEKAHPGIVVELERTPSDVYQEKLLTQYAAGVAPDVGMELPEFFQKFAKRKALLPLDSFIEGPDGVDLSQWYPGAVAAYRYQKQLYVLARDVAPIGVVYYNKKIFAEANLPNPDGTWTWDFEPRPELREKDFTWVMQQLTKKDAGGKTVRWGFATGWSALFTDTMAYSMGASYVDDREDTKRLQLDDPRFARVYQYVQDLAYKKRWIPSQLELTTSLQTNATDLFVQGRLAMFQGGIWEVPNLRKKLVPGTPGFFEWDITMAPAYKDGRLVVPSGGAGYCILSSTKHPREAWLLVKWMAGPEGAKELAASGLAQPAVRKLALSEPWIPGPNTPADQQYPHNRIITDRLVPHAIYDPSYEAYKEVKTYTDQTVEKIFMGTMSAQEALLEGQKRGQSRLDTIRAQSQWGPFPWGLGFGIGAVAVLGLVALIYAPEFRVKRSEKERRENRTAYLFIAPWVLGIFVFTLGPMIFSLLMSFSDWDVITPAKWRGVGNYTEAFTGDARFWVSLKVTLIYVAVSVPLGIAVSLGLALLLNVKVKGMPLYRTLFYLPSLSSGVAAALIWKAIFKADGGLLNTIIYGMDGKGNFLGLASLLAPLGKPGEPINWLGNENTALASLILMALWGAGGGMVILLAGLQGIPTFYYEAATVDGANRWTQFRRITIPLLAPALMFSLITGLIGSFQVFTQSYVMTAGGPGESTMFYMLHLYRQAFQSLRMGYAAALAWVLFLIILILTMLQLRLNKSIYYESEAR